MTAPLSTLQENAFKELVYPAILTPAELSLAGGTASGPTVLAQRSSLAVQHLHPDSAYIAAAKWDLWSFDVESLKWMHKPEPLGLTTALNMTAASPQSKGSLTAVGLRTLFTGTRRLARAARLRIRSGSSDHPMEHAFASWMSFAQPEGIAQRPVIASHDYSAGCGGWASSAGGRSQLWSEGE